MSSYSWSTYSLQYPLSGAVKDTGFLRHSLFHIEIAKLFRTICCNKPIKVRDIKYFKPHKSKKDVFFKELFFKTQTFFFFICTHA